MQPPLSLAERLAASADPSRGRRMLDAIEAGCVVRGGRVRRRISVRFAPTSGWLEREKLLAGGVLAGDRQER